MKKQPFLLFIVILLLAGNKIYAQEAYEKQLKTLADQLTAKIKPTAKKRVAVASFVDLQGNITELGKALAEEYSVYLSDNQLEVVERGQIDKLLRERKLPETGLLNPAQAAELGQISGIQIMVTGTITILDNSVKMILKAIDLEKAIMVGGTQGVIPRTASIDVLIRSIISRDSQSENGLNERQNTKYDDLYEREISTKKCNPIKRGYGNFILENRLNEKILIYSYKSYKTKRNIDNDFRPFDDSYNKNLNILILPGETTSTPLVAIDRIRDRQRIKFFFRTIGDDVREGTVELEIFKCKTRFFSLNSSNLTLISK